MDLDRFRFYGLHTLWRKVLGIGKHHVLATHKRSRWKVWNFSASGQKESNRQCSRFQQRVFSHFFLENKQTLSMFTLTWKTLFLTWLFYLASSLHFSRGSELVNECPNSFRSFQGTGVLSPFSLSWVSRDLCSSFSVRKFSLPQLYPRMSIPFGRDSISHSISLPSLKESRSLWTSLLPLSQILKKGGRGPLDGSDSPKRDRSQHPRVRSKTHLHPPFMDWRGQAPMSGAVDGSLVWGGCQRVVKGDRLVRFRIRLLFLLFFLVVRGGRVVRWQSRGLLQWTDEPSELNAKNSSEGYNIQIQISSNTRRQWIWNGWLYTEAMLM